MVAGGVLPIGVWDDRNAEQRGVKVEISARVGVYYVPVALSKHRNRNQLLRSSARDARTDRRVSHVRLYARANRGQARADPRLGRAERRAARADRRS